MRMDKLTRLRHAQQWIVSVQRRVWLAQVLMWPTVIAAGCRRSAVSCGSCGAGTPVVGMKCRIRRERTRWAPCKYSPTAGSPTSESGVMGACIVDRLSCRQTSVKMSGAMGTRTLWRGKGNMLEMRRLSSSVVTRVCGELEICLSVLCDVTVLADATAAGGSTDLQSVTLGVC